MSANTLAHDQQSDCCTLPRHPASARYPHPAVRPAQFEIYSHRSGAQKQPAKRLSARKERGARHPRETEAFAGLLIALAHVHARVYKARARCLAPLVRSTRKALLTSPVHAHRSLAICTSRTLTPYHIGWVNRLVRGRHRQYRAGGQNNKTGGVGKYGSEV